jgi:hypothetical protein
VNFDVAGNQLTGAIPALTGLTNLYGFNVNNNQLTGNVPPVPFPNALFPGSSTLCPNFLNHTPDPAWDVATGQSPWYSSCTALLPPSTTIPTLSDAALLLLGVLLIAFGFGMLHARSGRALRY